MYHQLSKFTGRLVTSANLQSPLFPVVPIALQRVDPPTIKYNTAQMSTVTESTACPAPGTRRLMPGTNIPYPPVSEAIKKKQELFQKDNDLPVHLKGGPMDVVLYRFTMFMCIVGLVGIGHTIYIHAIPKSQ